MMTFISVSAQSGKNDKNPHTFTFEFLYCDEQINNKWVNIACYVMFLWAPGIGCDLKRKIIIKES